MSDVKKYKTLYLCYFGLREPLVQTQVVAYLRGIAAGGIKVFLLTFEADPAKNWSAQEIEEQKQKLSAVGIDWNFLTYHKRPSVPATLFDIFCGAWFAWKAVRREKINVLHGRSHVAALMGALVKKFSRRPVKLIFDIRGLMAEEYADSGTWKKDGWLYNLVKRMEKWLLKKADGVVVLTRKAREFFFPGGAKIPVEVIPCCVDFSNLEKRTEDTGGRTCELIYAGQATGLYLLEEMGRFFLELKKKRPQAFFRLLTMSPPDTVHQSFAALGIEKRDYEVLKAPPQEVMSYLRRADIGISFRRAGIAQIAASPTKVPEYLAAGLPVISSSEIGDTDEFLRENKVGVIARELTASGLSFAVDQILELLGEGEIRDRCYNSALKNFDLERIGKVRYLSLYRQLEGTAGSEKTDIEAD